jgi:hypothetical protein
MELTINIELTFLLFITIKDTIEIALRTKVTPKIIDNT